MYTYTKPTTTSINRNKTYEGETLENKIYRIINNKEKIKDSSPLIYVERGTGVGAGYNIKTDRMEIALEATDKMVKAHIARRENKIGEQAKQGINQETPPTPPIEGNQQS